ncbi:MAG: hypothetical protein J5I94_08520, partial [Phaeodactylibacter sp.]|nr:hypothetical protein [Phaeodactylibacter sp.]
MKRRSFIKKGWWGLSGIGLAQSGFSTGLVGQKGDQKKWTALRQFNGQAPVVETYSRDSRVRSG